MTEKRIELLNIKKTFIQGGQKLTILDGADFILSKGEVAALVGPSGSGKSTLLYIAGLLESKDAGTVKIMGKDTTRMSDNLKSKMRLENIGFVYQQHNLMNDFTAIENVMMPQIIAGISKVEAKAKASELLSSMGLDHRMTHKPTALSGGEQQRVAIARALANSPQILLADEPTGNLDPHHSQTVFDLLLTMAKKYGTSVIVATHNPILAKKMDKRIALFMGKLVNIDDKQMAANLCEDPTGKLIIESFK